MNPGTLIALHVSGMLAIAGALLFAISDVFLLASEVGARGDVTATEVELTAYPALQRRAEALARLAAMPSWRLTWGGLLGVFAAPLTLAGIWQVYQGLRPAGAWLALPPALLLTYATGIGPFIHGSFMYLGDNARILNAVDAGSRAAVVAVLTRQLNVLSIGYGVLLACAVTGSIWFFAAVVSGRTFFPVWMAAINPVLLTLAWLAAKRILPRRIAAYTDGAGFNIAYLVFFALTTATLW